MTEATSHGARNPTRLPTRISPVRELLALMDQHERVSRRLVELCDIIDPDHKHGPDKLTLAPVTLSKSGLRLVASEGGALLFKGGPING